MLSLLWLVPALPLAGSIALVLFGSRVSRRSVAVIAAGSVGLAALVSSAIASEFFRSPPAGNAFVQTLWPWIEVGGFRPRISLYLDPLSLLMILVVTVVGFLIHLYSTEFMIEDEGYSRFFAYMNLFVAAMVVLVLGDNLLLLYLGWEGVGLCSYLLIGFWYRDAANGLAARKAFIVTRVGDTAMAIGLFLLFHELGTLDIQPLMTEASAQWQSGSRIAVVSAALLLAGALGKSAQLPLQTWLPDAMAGPTPTSALIHAATMVTAGVYLIARTHSLFALAPQVQLAVAIIGAATLLMAGLSALTQHDIKRILAYSTVSQIGYMFLALGVGAWGAAMFHFMTHAFFKALLFLAAGVVIEALHHEHDIFKMGGLRRELPLAFWAFLAGGASLAGLPLVTAGFYSKDLILWETLASPGGGPVFWVLGIAGVLLTALYTARLILVVFFGPQLAEVSRRPGFRMRFPLVVLILLAIAGGWVNLPPGFGDVRLFSDFIAGALPPVREGHAPLSESASGLAAAVMVGLGVCVAYFLYVRRRELVDRLTATELGSAVHRLWFSDWGFDWLYDRVFVRPIGTLARINRADFLDAMYEGVAAAIRLSYLGAAETQTGRLRWYAGGVAAGATILVAIALFL